MEVRVQVQEKKSRVEQRQVWTLQLCFQCQVWFLHQSHSHQPDMTILRALGGGEQESIGPLPRSSTLKLRPTALLAPNICNGLQTIATVGISHPIDCLPECNAGRHAFFVEKNMAVCRILLQISTDICAPIHDTVQPLEMSIEWSPCPNS